MSSQPLSIAFIVRDALPPVRADVLTLFGTEMPRYGVTTELVGQGGSGADGIWLAGGMHAVGSLDSRFAGICAPLWDMLGLARALKGRPGRRPDCIQVRDKIASGLLGRIAAALLRIPFIYWMSFPIVEGFEVRRDAIGREGRGLLWLAHALRAWASRIAIERLVLPGARHIFVQSDAMADWLAAKGIARARMTAVLYLGRIARSRRSDFLLDVIEVLRRDVPQVLLVIAGDAPSNDEMAWMRDEIATRGLHEHVLLTGWLPQRTALGYAVRAEVGLSPIPRGTLFDVSSPTKLVEYLALGIPSVANDIPDQRAVIEASGAGLCAPMEAGPFAAAVLALLRDPARAAALAQRGPPYVRSHRTYAVLGKNVAITYKKILMERA
jgi:glycosyltransferase involved in cell wall biosynthesis